MLPEVQYGDAGGHLKVDIAFAGRISVNSAPTSLIRSPERRDQHNRSERHPLHQFSEQSSGPQCQARSCLDRAEILPS